MISKKLQDAINMQINAEMWSANLYLSMSYYLAKEGYTGFASWMKKQSQEEMEHAYKLADYLIDREGTVKLDKLDVVPTGWGTPLEAFEHTFEHEKRVSEMINKLVEMAENEKDYATQDFLSWFVNEQVEEEATARSIVKRIKIAGDAGLYFVNNELGAR
ncbi:ferritin [Bacteroides sp. 224]|uniref:ferritin n=1 Tax=Bacteroides sp. 224 TaxID=2302936 RepID=UPI0013D4BAA1|nr:ferritin [Bacteroides sp. 224]NDV66193.1 ferritin [Bacteroides sp. 224]